MLVDTTCAYCHASIQKRQVDINKTDKSFCNSSHAAKYNNKKYPKKVKEKKLCIECGINEVSVKGVRCLSCASSHNKTTKCIICGKELKDTRRRKCSYCNIKIRRQRIKLKAIQLLGGKCARCGWTGDPAAFEFHHRDKSQKEFCISRYSNKKWELVKNELAKCELLCANCHRIKHSDRNGKTFTEEVNNYKGRSLG